jgi:hypothetical protein
MSSLYSSFYNRTPGLQVKRDMNVSNVTIQCDPRLVVPNNPANQTSGIFKKDTAGKLAVEHEICNLDVSNLTVGGQTTLNNTTVSGSLTVNGAISGKKVVNTTFDDSTVSNQSKLKLLAGALAQHPIGTVVTQVQSPTITVTGTLAEVLSLGGTIMTVSTTDTFTPSGGFTVGSEIVTVTNVEQGFAGTLSSSQSNTIFRVNGDIYKTIYLPAPSTENVGVTYDFHLTTVAVGEVEIVLPTGSTLEAVMGLTSGAGTLSSSYIGGTRFTFPIGTVKGSRITITCICDFPTQIWSSFSLSGPSVPIIIV